MATDRPACGLSSFLPMSCRGRAEAFARRLQSRLQSLGRQSSDEHPSDSEQSWLTSSQHFPGATTSLQPARLSSSSESDVYFDFDVDCASPGSPLEDAGEHICLNDAGCARVGVPTAVWPGSPLEDAGEDICLNDALCARVGVPMAASPGSDDGDLYFEARVDLSCNSDVTDDAGVVPSWAATRARKPRVDHTKCNGVSEHRQQHLSCEDNRQHARVHKANVELEMESRLLDTIVREADAELETETHELETIVREADAELETETHELEAIVHEADAELKTETHELEAIVREADVVLASETHELEAIVREADGELETETHELETIVLEADVVLATETHERYTRIHEADVELMTETHEEAVTRIHEADVELETETHEEAVTRIHEAEVEACRSQAAWPERGGENSVATLGCPGVEITAAAAEPAREVEPRGAARGAGAARTLEVAGDDTDDEERPQRVRRCSSLKTGKTPPGTPGRKKIVRFADVLGLDLADVRTFLDEVPKVPTSAYEDLQCADLSSALSALPRPDKTLVPMFVQPGGCADFLDRVREQQVCLENAVVSDVMLATISGTVRVRNLDFNKSVHIRYSVDAWTSFSDLQATYVHNSCDGFSDTFSFVMYAHTLTVGQRLEFAVRFQCHGCQYWDSNRGGNYVFQCLPPSGQLPFRCQPAMSTCPDEQWASFY